MDLPLKIRDRLIPEYIVYAGKSDKIKEVYPSELGNFYTLQSTQGLWHYSTLIPHGRSITVSAAHTIGKPEKETKEAEVKTFRGETGYKGPGKIYVGNLPYGFSDTALLKLFIKFGTIRSADIVTDIMSGRSKGFGFVTMVSEDEAQNAIRELHNQVIFGDDELVSDYNSPDLINENSQKKIQLSIISIIETASRELVRLVCHDPRKLQDIEWRDLERMLAVVFDGIGYTVQLTRPAKDGGKDIIIEFIASNQKQSYYVEVKHWVSGQKVGNKIVREFLSVVVRDQQQGGIIISTSGFSASAMEGITEIERKRLRLGNKDTVVSLCRTYLNLSSGLMRPTNLNDTIVSVTQDKV